MNIHIPSEKSVTVITPTIGTSYVTQAIESVQLQRYRNLTHLIVVDGAAYQEPFYQNFKGRGLPPKIQVATIPSNSGANGFVGHRIYASFPHLVDSDYIAFLDEDNWFEPEHISSLVHLVESRNLDWAYSLRNIYSQEGEFVAPDCCESLGKWPTHISLTRSPNNLHYMVDTSTYFFKRSWLIEVCHLWHASWGGDRRFYQLITQRLKHTNFHTTAQHTMNYRLTGDIQQKYGGVGFFLQGNEVVRKAYGGQYPWLV